MQEQIFGKEDLRVEDIQNNARQRAIAKAKKLNIPLHKLLVGGRIGDWLDITYLMMSKKKIRIMR